MTQGHFPLPHTIATSPPSSADSGPTFPRLKVKFTPRVTLPTNVAPQKPKPKALEETIKVVASLGRKIAISWSVNAASLLETGILPEGAQEAFEDSIGSWVLKVGHCVHLHLLISEPRPSGHRGCDMGNG